MDWKRNPLLDGEKAETDKGVYLCVRTFADISKLYFNDEMIFSSGSGSHQKSKAFAEEHYRKLP